MPLLLSVNPGGRFLAPTWKPVIGPLVAVSTKE